MQLKLRAPTKHIKTKSSSVANTSCSLLHSISFSVIERQGRFPSEICISSKFKSCITVNMCNNIKAHFFYMVSLAPNGIYSHQ